MDWNEDGKKDLVSGDSSGYLNIFLNTGTNANPAFSSSFQLTVGGSVFNSDLRSMPEVVDWNNDGRKDVLCGDDYGNVRLLLNTGTNASPSFAAWTYLQDGGQNLDVGAPGNYDRSGPAVADWNHDGRKDLLSGRYDGKVVCFLNQGTDAAPVFSGKTLLRVGYADLDAGYYSRIEVADWDADGTPDLMAGNYDGTVLFFRAIPPGSTPTPGPSPTPTPTPIPLAQALDAPAPVWTTSGDAPWFAQCAVTSDGIDAAQSGDIDDDGVSILSAAVLGPGSGSFMWSVSSEAAYDFLTFYIDSVAQPGAISGAVSWAEKSFQVPAGAHTLRWVYSKDFSVSSGSDRGWVDRVQWSGNTAARHWSLYR